ncbi:MAG: hypothetical protein IKM18_06000 [Clostridia bacterium]|nr:hypothetical protein [Clostridia bacterium]
MKKLIAILLTLACLLALIACDNGIDDDEYDGKPEIDKGDKEKDDENNLPFDDSLILLESDRKKTAPYENCIWKEYFNGSEWEPYWHTWNGVSVLYGGLTSKKDEIPQISYTDDFKIHYGEGTEFISLSVYDEQNERICYSEEDRIPVYLFSGSYYLVIKVKKQGKYIEKEKKHEWSKYECAYRFEISNENEIDFKISKANGAKFKDYSLNADKFDSDDGVRHLPVFKFDSVAELKQFKEQFGGEKVYDYDYGNEAMAFNEATREYDDEFFAENSLMLVYITENYTCYQHGLKSLSFDGNSFVAHVLRKNDPEMGGALITEYFMTFEVKKSDLENITEFDAIFAKREK